MTADLAAVDDQQAASDRALADSQAAASQHQAALDRLTAESSDTGTALGQQLQKAIASQDELSNQVQELSTALQVGPRATLVL